LKKDPLLSSIKRRSLSSRERGAEKFSFSSVGKGGNHHFPCPGEGGGGHLEKEGKGEVPHLIGLGGKREALNSGGGVGFWVVGGGWGGGGSGRGFVNGGS